MAATDKSKSFAELIADCPPEEQAWRLQEWGRPEPMGTQKLPPITGMFENMVLGENASAFKRVEFFTNQLRIGGTTHHLALVGVPSTGKTTTALRVAGALERPVYEGGGSCLNGDPIKSLGEIVQRVLGVFPEWVDETRFLDRQVIHIIKPMVIFLDEAHRITDAAQAELLRAMEEPFHLNFNGITLDFSQVMFILGTTDFSMLTAPLQSRAFPIPFVTYSIESVSQMVLGKYPTYSPEDAVLIARAGKGLPRNALRLADLLQQAPGDSVAFTLKDLFGVDDLGLDEADRKILAALRTHTAFVNPRKLAESKAIVAASEAGEKVSVIILARATAFLSTLTAPAPLAQKALGDRLSFTDQGDLFTRVVYLETLGLVMRTRSGVQAISA